jgi:BirA family biotin operon repressor/biotin-[acetyl-CoA-carboxylase] ligase
LHEKGDILPSFFAVSTDFQTNGKGSRQKSWQSEAGKNLLTSIWLDLQVPVKEQFTISFRVALSIAQFLTNTCKIADIRIKYPNDIYAGRRKICGILIENILSNNFVKNSIVGIGLNVNQLRFSPTLPNPTSIFLQTNKEWNIFDCLSQIVDNLKVISNLPQEIIHKKYQQKLYLLGQICDFQVHNDHFLQAKIEGVDTTGNLIVSDNNQQYRFAHNEITMIVES